MKPITTKKDETPEFVEFWEKVWRSHARETDGRGDARDAFIAHVRAGADPQDIVDGAKHLIRTFKDFQFLPLAKTWINKRAYEDMAEQHRAHQARALEYERRREHTNVVQIQPPASEAISPERRAELVAKIRLQRA
jgi:hypothetical protein